MKKNTVQAPKKQNNASFGGMLLMLAFAVYALIVFSAYMKNNGLVAGKVISMIFDYFTPFMGSERGLDALVLNLAGDFYRILVPLLLSLAGYGFGRAALKYIPAPGMNSELGRILVATGLGILVLIVLLFILGTVHLLALVPVIIVLVCGTACAFVVPPDLTALKDELRLTGLPLLLKISIGVSALLLVIVFIATLVPEIFYDSQVYHIASANWYKLVHGVQPPLSKTVHFFIPGYARLLYTVCLILSDEISAKFLHFFYGILTAGLLFAVGKNWFNRNTGIFAALAFVTMPSIGIVGVRSSMENFLCFFEFLSLVCALQFISSRERKWLIFSGIFLGAAVGSKYLSLMSWVSIGIILIIDAIASRKPLKEAFLNALAWNAALIAAAGAWFAYNIYYTGNPVYPALWQYIGHLQIKQFTAVEELGKMFGIVEILKSPWMISMGLKEEAYAGIMFLLLIPLIFFTKWYKTNLKYVAVYAVVYWLLWMRIGPYFYFRYYLPAMPAACLLAGYAASRFDGKTVRFAVLSVVLINSAYVATVLKAIYYPVDYVTGNISKSQYLSSNRQTYPNPYYPAAEWINKNLKKDAKVLIQGDERAYYLERQYVPITLGDRNYMVTLLEKAKDADDFARLLRADGITHIFLNVPEAKRMKGYDLFHYSPREFGILIAFWDGYVKEVHRDIADITLLQKGIFSMRQQQPQWWQQYAADESNYMYVYEIMPDAEAAVPHSAPRNFLKDPTLYPDSRWKEIETTFGRR